MAGSLFIYMCVCIIDQFLIVTVDLEGLDILVSLKT